MLEQQQDKLCAALRELYCRLERNERWTGPPLSRNENGLILTHNILDRLNLLRSGPDDTSGFEENVEILKDRMQREEIVQLPTPTSLHAGFSPETGEVTLDPPSSSIGNDLDVTLDQYQDFGISQAPTEHFVESDSYFPTSINTSMASDFYSVYRYTQDPGGFTNSMPQFSPDENYYHGLSPGTVDPSVCLPTFSGHQHYASHDITM